MKFRYPFQKLVDLKSNEKSQAEWFLSKAIGRLRDEEMSLHELRMLKERIYDELNVSSQRKVTVAEIVHMQSYIDHLDQKIMEKNKDIQSANIEVTLKRSHLNDKVIEEKVWHKAKEKAFEHFQVTLRKKEQEEMDEIAGNRPIDSLSLI